MIYHSLILVFLIVYPVNISAQDCTGTLNLNFSGNYSVKIGDSIKTGEQLSFQLNPGVHIVHIRGNKNDWKIIKKDTINIPRCDSLYHYNYNTLETGYLRTEPSDVKVYRDSNYLGSTPLVINLNHERLLLKKTGYKGLILDDSLKSRMSLINLIPENLYKDRTSFLETTLPHILTGSLIVLGGISAYTKLKADRYYEQYSAFGYDNDLKNMRKYDLLSGISFGLLQINLAYLVYNFLIAGN